MTTTGSMEIVTTRTGVTELRRRWSAHDPWATALIVHGLAEHSGRYERMGSRLAAAGISTHAFDLQGFGASGGRRADIESWSTYLVQVLDNLLPLFATRLPVVLVGHSVGGLIAIDYTLSRHRQPDLVVLHAPAVDATVPAWKAKAAFLLSGLTPGLTLGNPIDPDEIFSDPAMAEGYRNDPLIYPRTTMRLGAMILRRMEHVRQSLDAYSAPTLVAHGSHDWLVPTATSLPLANLPNVQRRVYEGVRHGCLNEITGERVVDDMAAWVRASIGTR